jgi:hypothetical protein
MEQRALRNVRGLIDKLEDREQAERWTPRQFIVVLGIVVTVLAVAAAVMVVVMKEKRASQKMITLPPPAQAPK